ncbi:hypothetical protein GIB67_033494 [Kingdonia uniflora]|uniref:NAB domain-containing protein n=1 Tax=Kingdonia uniflora TaxID=39325 RepID=A0A7J7L672_9MAGN|nr:hypothetical protein GIB67_033494 [Kingdonia uniflora]
MAAAALRHSESRRLYSWWWDSHISPKNSKWLQENLTDMDVKVKSMIKLIEEDADSFARRAEMYYKKRPELMKLVEEFYRAYRALAERYDHATGALRQAHRTMAEAFPNQVPLILTDDSPSGLSNTDVEPHTPEMSHFDTDDLSYKRSGAYSDESDSIRIKKGLKQFNDIFGSKEGAARHVKFAEGRVRKGLDFQNEERSKVDIEVQNLKEAFKKLEAEKEAGHLKYQEALERLSNLETEVAHAEEMSRRLNQQASKAETEVQTLNQALIKLQTEKGEGLIQYQQCLETICNLENRISCAQEDSGRLNERATKAEMEVENLKEALARLETEKVAGLLQYNQCLETITNLENKLSHAEEDGKSVNDRADKIEAEVQSLRQAITNFNEEKEAFTLQYNLCLETISRLEGKVSITEEEAKNYGSKIAMGVEKFNIAEEKHLMSEKANQSLQAELNRLVQKIGMQEQELLEKHKNLEELRISVQEEHLRSMQAESALETLQSLHFESQEERKALTVELENRVQMLKDIECKSRGLEDELRQVKEINTSLNEQNLCSAMSIKNLQNEIFSVMETKGKLEQEVELYLNQRNALQQEIYCLKEEINDLNRKYQGVIEQVESVGFKPDLFGSSVKDLQDENTMLKEIFQKEKGDKLALLEKLEMLEGAFEKNTILENSLSDVNVELKVLRERVASLEKTCQSLEGEKSILVTEKAILVSELETATENVHKLSVKNTLLENSFSDANCELEGLRISSKSLKESCQSLDNEKSALLNERNNLVSELKCIRQRLDDLEKRCTGLEEKNLNMEKEMQSGFDQVEELKSSLDLEKQENASSTQSSETRMACLEDQIQILHEEGRWRMNDIEKEQEKFLKAQFEIFILQKFIQELEERNVNLFIESQKHFKAFEFLKELVSKLEQENLEYQVNSSSLLNQAKTLSIGIYQILKLFKIETEYEVRDDIDDSMILQQVLGGIKDMKSSLLKTEDQKQQLVFEKSVLIVFLEQLKSEAVELESERNIFDQELKMRNQKILMLQNEKHELMGATEQLRLEVIAHDAREEVLETEMESQYTRLSDLQETYLVSQNENSKLLQEHRLLVKAFSCSNVKSNMLEEQNDVILEETMALDICSLIFMSFGAEKALEVKYFDEEMDHLQGVIGGLEKGIRSMGEMLEVVQMEKLKMEESVEHMKNELNREKIENDQLNAKVGTVIGLLCLKEMELLEAGQMFKDTENENVKLEKNVKGLIMEADGANVIREVLQKKNVKLSEDNTRHNMEIACLRESNEKFELQLAKLREKVEEQKDVEDKVLSEIQEKGNEVNLWETRASTLYEELQISNICAVLFKEKVHEYVEACESFEGEKTSKDAEIEQLKERLVFLEGENEGMKSTLAAYFPAVNCLKENIQSLEEHVLSHIEVKEDDDHEKKEQSYQESCEKQTPNGPDAILNLQELQARVKVLENALMEMKRHTTQESLDTINKLEGAIKHIDELESKPALLGEEGVKTESVISKVQSEISMKDIPLDQVSDSSSYDHVFAKRALTRKEKSQTDEQMLELWETSSELQVEKELGVDKLEVSKRYTETQLQGNKRKILERLASDHQKLMNLQVTIQDLKKKSNQSETSKSKSETQLKYSNLKEQLHEFEDSAIRLINVNNKLSKKSEEGPVLSDGEDTGKLRRRKVLAQARRGSEEIGRLQLEVQKIQFVLLKLDEEQKTKGTKLADRKVVLKDYIYGGGKVKQGRKKSRFCGCIRPSSNKVD